MFSFKRQTGNQAENLALIYLQENGLQLIEQNYLTIVFVEVRYRQNDQFGSATDTVDRHKQNKLIRTAQHYLQQFSKYQEFICRFDVVGVESDLKYPKINWIKNAFEVQ